MQLALLLLASVTTLTLACIPTKTPSPGIPVPACKKCSRDMIQNEPTEPGWGAFAADSPDLTGACAVINFVCSGAGPAPAPYIKLNGMYVYDLDDGTADLVAHATVTCNADGSAWTYTDGTPITLATCFPR
ncbi:hypothetical protein PRIPAC_78627 [Pristionchus pacificus]|uniref:C6 domain-containing protein n=1 Tax=Pristionchus pacificus TaxID=54126 RepID=A0A2A6CPU9_PRIPA|nr:hypothetical protein PRIPAC_78627 [Pristionchus pacificus]|eukprot:PDM80232.1 hypothetical protein PRIPAC_32811 [Pristionchus pacificus]